MRIAIVAGSKTPQLILRLQAGNPRHPQRMAPVMSARAQASVAELDAAQRAVRLASKLCKVFATLLSYLRMARNTPAAAPAAAAAAAAPLLYPTAAAVLCESDVSLQDIQLQLSSAEKVDKPDDSPVTVADYGARTV